MMSSPSRASASGKIRICCIGAGYVGATALAILASQCPEVTVTVTEAEFLCPSRIDDWNSDSFPIYEPDLDGIIHRHRNVNLFFSKDCKRAVQEANIIFISVHTPTKKHGLGAGRAADLEYVERCSRYICEQVETGWKIVVEMSTVPVRCAAIIQRVLDCCGHPQVRFDVLSNPSFRAAASAVHDLLNPDRVLIGHQRTPQGQEAASILCQLYAHWVAKEKIVCTDLWSSELTKLATNAFLSQRVSSINAISAVCDATGADVDEVAFAIGRDSRLGPQFLKASPGFGGVAFQKDILNLVYLCYSLGLKEVGDYWMKVIDMNNYQKKRFSATIVHTMFDTITHKNLAVWGFAFKKGTSDCRETCALSICSYLLDEDANLTIYDPKVPAAQIKRELLAFAGDNARLREAIQTNVHSADSAPAAAKGSHAVIVLTDWEEFTQANFAEIYESMTKPAFLFDSRAYLSHAELRQIGFTVVALGKPTSSLTAGTDFSLS